MDCTDRDVVSRTILKRFRSADDALRPALEGQRVVPRQDDIGQPANLGHGCPAGLGVRAAGGSILLEVLVLVDHVAGEDRRSDMGLDDHSLAARSMTPQREYPDAGHDLLFTGQLQRVRAVGQRLLHVRRQGVYLLLPWLL